MDEERHPFVIAGRGFVGVRLLALAFVQVDALAIASSRQRFSVRNLPC